MTPRIGICSTASSHSATKKPSRRSCADTGRSCGACRRQLANRHDAEDAFQATFLVLVRRAARLDYDLPLGPWLYRGRDDAQRDPGIAAAPGLGPMEHEVHARSISRNGLTSTRRCWRCRRDRVPVVLCHLQDSRGAKRRSALGVRKGRFRRVSIARWRGCGRGSVGATWRRWRSPVSRRFRPVSRRQQFTRQLSSRLQP